MFCFFITKQNITHYLCILSHSLGFYFKTQKAILDTELDIISKESEGADTTELRRKVAELKRQVSTIDEHVRLHQQSMMRLLKTSVSSVILVFC